MYFLQYVQSNSSKQIKAPQKLGRMASMRGTTRITDDIHPSLFCDNGAVHFTPGFHEGIFCGSFHQICLAFVENRIPSLRPINVRSF